MAIAVMYLAVKLSKFEVKDWMNRLQHHHNWWDQFVDDLEASGNQSFALSLELQTLNCAVDSFCEYLEYLPMV